MTRLVGLRAWVLDVPRVVLLEQTLLSVGWAALLAMPYCLTCQATFEGLHAHGSEAAWTARLAFAAVLGIAALLSGSEWARAVALVLMGCVWSLMAAFFWMSPTPAPGGIVYSIGALRVCWALWWGGTRR